jgi:ABC-type antimicrobial peptide transport system permease subunit
MRLIKLGFRFVFRGGREALIRFTITVLALSIGVALLSLTFATLHAVQAQNQKAAWLDTGSPSYDFKQKFAAQNVTPLWWLFTTDQFETQTIYRVDVAPTSPTSPVPPGISRLPGPGQYFVSPALATLMQTTPASQFGNRFPGKQVGQISSVALPSPNDLVIIIGHTAGQLSAIPGAARVTTINTTPSPSISSNTQEGASVSYSASNMKAVIAIGALALLLPVLVLISAATRIATARKEQRFAAMRLVGATPRQITVIATVESGLAAAGGVIVGLLLFFPLSPLLRHFSLTGQPFWQNDISLSVGNMVSLALGIPLIATTAGWFSLRRVRISPLGVAQRVTPHPPRAYRVLPLLAGLLTLVYFATFGKPHSIGGQIDGYFGAFLLTMLGIIIAGPWLMMAGSRLALRRVNKAEVLLAARHLSDDPRGGFRTISGLVLALFVTTVTVSTTGTILRAHASPTGTANAYNTLVDQLGSVQASGLDGISLPSIPNDLISRARAIPGVSGVLVIHTPPNYQIPRDITPSDIRGLASCKELAQVPTLGKCATGATVSSLYPDFGFSLTQTSQSGTVWPAGNVPAQELSRLPVEAVVLYTNNSSTTLEQARTLLEQALPYQGPPTLVGGIAGENAQTFQALQRIANLVIVASMVIAGCSLAVNVVSAITERKRPFTLLRLAGVPVSMLRKVVAIETGTPLVIIAVLSVGLGLLASELFLKSQLQLSLHPPTFSYYAAVVGGILLSLGVIGATLPIIEEITKPDSARFE